MRQYEFEACVESDQTVKIPAEIAANIGSHCPVRVVVLVPDSDEDDQWRNLTTDQFLQGYAESDGIYDDLSAG